MFLGYTLALLSILGVAKVAVAMLVLAVPIIDAFWIIVRRMARKRSPFVPDRGHIHHRLLDVGLSQTQTVLLIYALCLGLAVLSFVLSGGAQLVAFALFVVAAGLGLYALSRGTNGTGGGNGRTQDVAAEAKPEPKPEPKPAAALGPSRFPGESQ